MTAHVVAASLLHLDELMTVMADSFDPGFGEAWTRPQLAAALASEINFVRMLRDERGGQGFSLCRAAGPEVELLLVAVRPQARHRGIGGTLLDTAIADAAARGAVEIFLEVRANNVAAQQLYRSRRFDEVGRRSNYYTGAGGLLFDAITMRRVLERASLAMPESGAFA